MFNTVSSIGLLTNFGLQQLLLIGGIIVIIIIVIIWLLSSGKKKEAPAATTEKAVEPKATVEDKPETKVEEEEEKEEEVPEEAEKEEEVKPEKEEIGRSEVIGEFQELTGIGKAYAESLYDNGFTSLETVAKGNIEDLTNVEGIGGSTAEQIKDEAKKKIKE